MSFFGGRGDNFTTELAGQHKGLDKPPGTEPPKPLLTAPSIPQFAPSSRPRSRGRGFSSTILTSGGGLSAPATVGSKSLIGQ